MIRFCSLGSGSDGNSLVVEAHAGITATRVLIDCGFSMREMEARLARRGLAPTDLHGIFITHEHGDHIGSAITLAQRYELPLWMSKGTWRAVGEPTFANDTLLRFARDGLAITIGDLEVRPYTVPHDAREPLQVRCSDGAQHLGVLTDAGSVTTHLLSHLQSCDALLIECNHDADMLAKSQYPASLKARIGGPLGHLANQTATEILSKCSSARLRHVIAAHLSKQNNTPALASAALAAGCGGHAADIVLANQAIGFEWLSLG